ncbi:MAG TPA: hypothetical protein VN132_02740 [Bdellovibrio sp.]|nr:hypothetical protein [Bdellovibrio sp.]
MTQPNPSLKDLKNGVNQLLISGSANKKIQLDATANPKANTSESALNGKTSAEKKGPSDPGGGLFLLEIKNGQSIYMTPAQAGLFFEVNEQVKKTVDFDSTKYYPLNQVPGLAAKVKEILSSLLVSPTTVEEVMGYSKVETFVECTVSDQQKLNQIYKTYNEVLSKKTNYKDSYIPKVAAISYVGGEGSLYSTKTCFFPEVFEGKTETETENDVLFRQALVLIHESAMRKYITAFKDNWTPQQILEKVLIQDTAIYKWYTGQRTLRDKINFYNAFDLPKNITQLWIDQFPEWLNMIEKVVQFPPAVENFVPTKEFFYSHSQKDYLNGGKTVGTMISLAKKYGEEMNFSGLEFNVIGLPRYEEAYKLEPYILILNMAKAECENFHKPLPASQDDLAKQIILGTEYGSVIHHDEKLKEVFIFDCNKQSDSELFDSIKTVRLSVSKY